DLCPPPLGFGRARYVHRELGLERLGGKATFFTGVDGDTGGNREKPGRGSRRLRAVEPSKRAAGADEHLLGKILDVRAGSERPREEREYRPLVPNDESVERGGISGSASLVGRGVELTGVWAAARRRQ